MRSLGAILVLVTAILLTMPVTAQNKEAIEPSQVDAHAAKILDKISSITKSADVDYDKLEAANKELREYLKKALVIPTAMSLTLKKSGDAGLQVLTSKDKKVRFCSWDTQSGGTMHMFNSLVVYDAGNNQLKCEIINPPAKTEEGGDPGTTFEDLDSLKTKDGKTVYLVRDLSIASGMIHGRSIQAYVLTGGKLTKFPFFQTPKKALDNIDFAFGEYSDDTEIKLSSDKNTLKIPIIKEDKNGASGGLTTGKFLIYQFDGNRFVFQKGK